MTDPLSLICPYPRRIAPRGDACRLTKTLHIQRGSTARTSDVDRVLRVVSSNWSGRSLPRLVDGEPRREEQTAGTLHLALGALDTPEPEAYTLRVEASGISLLASRPVGLFRGLMTLAQWIRIHSGPELPAELPGLLIEDAPALLHRGVVLDISRDRVPTMRTLYVLVDRLAEWKVNQLQLYTEHTFAYHGHGDVWASASPMTGEEIESLDRFCRERFIELVPNQNSFGHFHRWLKWPRYRPLAECPEGLEHPFSDVREPFSLCPTDPHAIDLLADLYDQLLPHFTSRLFNVGLDETFDLGAGRSADACRERGTEAVYLDYLRAVHGLVEERGHRMQFWGDIILANPGDSEPPSLPENSIPLAWGYEADHPFDRDLARLRASGLDFYACPGTSSWNSLAGRTSNALDNLKNACQAADRHGADGVLVTDWGDNGHLQPPPVSYCGLLAGACRAWNPDHELAHDDSFEAALQQHAFPHVAGAGAAFAQLGDVYLATGAPIRNGTVLFHLLVSPQHDLEHPRYESLTLSGLEATREAIHDAGHNLIMASQDNDPESDLVRREFRWIAELLEFACDLGEARLNAGRSAPISAIPHARRRVLLDVFTPLVEAHAGLWLARSREGGRADSLARLERLASHLGGSD